MKQIIHHNKKKYGWEFLFFGANIDAVETAGHFGIDADQAVDYHADREGTQLNYEVLSETITNVRCNRKVGASWKQRIAEDFRQRGGKRCREKESEHMNFNNEKDTKSITCGTLLGLAVGDALGVPVEFMSRIEVRRVNLREMIGKDTGAPFETRWGDLIPKGAWSDDTSMTIATMASMIEQGGEIDYDDIMQKYLDWWEGGQYCSIDFPFGIGETVSRAMCRFKADFPVTECGGKGMWDNGNGALMRILPFSLYCIFRNRDFDKTVAIINQASAITHGHPISQMGCLIFTVFLNALLERSDVGEAWDIARTRNYQAYFSEETIHAYALLLSDAFLSADDSYIGERGYVVDTLMTAVYSLLRGCDYVSSVLCAVNMGGDTDTNAAVSGALAGAFYGVDRIPKRWLDSLRKRTMLERIACDFAKAVPEMT